MSVRIVYLDPNPSGAKVGLDDYFAAKGTVQGLKARAEDDLRPLPREEAENSGPYAATPAGFIYRKPTPSGPIDQLLTNFTAQITEEIIADDGASERADLVIEGQLGDEALPALRVPPRRFSSLEWVSQWGSRPRIGAGMGTRDRAREAIQYHSPTPERRRVFEHTGWRYLEGHGWVYLHAGGAIGAEGAIAGIDVALRGAASRILFPELLTGEALRDAVRASLSLIELAPDTITIPLLGATYRASLCALLAADLSAFLIGPTGVFKSEAAAIAMQHYGVAFDRLHLAANWSATANFLERAAFDFKDALLAVDDFAPHGTQTDIARLHATADRVLRGIGNRGGRGRMNADGSLRTDYPPRGIVIGTGEDAPRGQSLRARMAILDVAPGDICRDRLSVAQQAGRRGVFVGAMGGFLQWTAPQFDALCASLPALLADFRAKAYQSTGHTRTPEAVAHLALGWWALPRYAKDVDALTQSEAHAMFDRAWSALGETGARQASYQAGEEPARRFIDLLGSALSGGYAHVAGANGEPPFAPQAWGWRQITVGTGENQRTDWQPQGGRAGWLEREDLYVDLEAALTAAQRVAQATGSGVSVTARTLAKRLHERGFLLSTDLATRGEIQVRRVLEGRRRRTLHLAASAITLEESAQSAHADHKDPESGQSRGSESNNGRVSWADYADGWQESAHETRPHSAESRQDEQDGRIGRAFTADTAHSGESSAAFSEDASASEFEANAPFDCVKPWDCGQSGPCAGYRTHCPLAVARERQAGNSQAPLVGARP